jgi:hypothetical protein
MPQPKRTVNIYPPLPLGPELPAVQRRAALRIGIVVGAALLIPAAILAYGYANQWQSGQRYWLVLAGIWFVISAAFAAWRVHRIVKRRRSDEAVRIEFAPDFLTIVKRYSQVEIDYSCLAGMRLVYRPAAHYNGMCVFWRQACVGERPTGAGAKG